MKHLSQKRWDFQFASPWCEKYSSGMCATIGLCRYALAEKHNVEMARTVGLPSVFALDYQMCMQFCLTRGDRQMTEIFVSAGRRFPAMPK